MLPAREISSVEQPLQGRYAPSPLVFLKSESANHANLFTLSPARHPLPHYPACMSMTVPQFYSARSDPLFTEDIPEPSQTSVTPNFNLLEIREKVKVLPLRSLVRISSIAPQSPCMLANQCRPAHGVP